MSVVPFSIMPYSMVTFIVMPFGVIPYGDTVLRSAFCDTVLLFIMPSLHDALSLSGLNCSMSELTNLFSLSAI